MRDIELMELGYINMVVGLLNLPTRVKGLNTYK